MRDLIILFLGILSLLFISCNSDKQKQVIVDFSNRSVDSISTTAQNDEAIHVAIASMNSPKETFSYYHEFLQYVSEIIDIPIHYIQKESYDEVNKLLANGEVDFAFICSGAYINEEKNNTIDLLVAPVINDKTYYQAYIITNKEAEAESFSDLKNKSFAFTDPLSHTGLNYPIKRLKDLKTNKELFFSDIVFTYGHDVSIQMINRGIIDAAAVHGLIYDYLAEFDPEKVKNTKIIEKSDWYGIPPIVTPKSLDKKRYKLYQDIMLNIHRDETGKKLLKKLRIEKFILINDTIYDNARQLKQYIRNENS